MAALLGQSDRALLVRLAQKQEKGRRALSTMVAKLRRHVTDAVGRSPALLERLGGRRHRVLGAELHVEEGGKSLLAALRYGEVSVYDYDRDVLISAITDLMSGRVVRVVEHPGAKPPPVPEEVNEAAALAAQGQLARRWRARQVVATAVPARESSLEDHPCYGHRAFTLYFWTRGPKARRVAGPYLVDLSKQRVVPPDQQGAVAPAGAKERNR
jgi:hypothetical protein